MTPPSNDADRPKSGGPNQGAQNDGAPKSGGTAPPAVGPGAPQTLQGGPPPEQSPPGLGAKIEPTKPEPAKSEPAKSEPAKSEPAKSEPAKPTAGMAPASPPPKPDPGRTDPPVSAGPKVEPGRPGQHSVAAPSPVKADATSPGAPSPVAAAGTSQSPKAGTEPPKPAGAPVAAAKPGAKTEPATFGTTGATEAAPIPKNSIKAEPPKAEPAKTEPPKPDFGKTASGPISEPAKSSGGPSQAGPRPGGALTDGPIIDMKAKRVGDDAGGAAVGGGGVAAGVANGDTAKADAKPAGSGSAPPRVGPTEAPVSARGPGFGSVAAAGLLGGVIGAGLLFAVERAGILGHAGDDARIDALDQRISGQFTGLDQRMAALSPREAVAALDRRIAANEATLKPLPDAVKAAEASAKQALDRAGGAPPAAQAASAEGQPASPATAAAPAVPADIAARLDSLDQRVSALQEEPGREQPADARLGVVQAGDGGRQIAALDERVKALEGKAPDAKAAVAQPQPVDLAPKLASLQGEIEARTKADAEADQVLGQRLDALQKTLDDRVKAATEAVQTATQAAREAAEAGKTQTEEATKALDRRLQDQSDRIAALDKAVALRAEAATVQAALKVVTADRIAGALDAGVPYAEPLATLRRLETGDASRVDALGPFAEAGAPTAVQLAAAFRPIADRIAAARKAAAAKDVAATGDMKSRFLSIADSIVQVRKVDAPAPAESAETDPAAKVQAALDRGALVEASQAYEALPQDAKAQAGDFGATLKARAQAAQAARALLSDAFKGLPAGAPGAVR